MNLWKGKWGRSTEGHKNLYLVYILFISTLHGLLEQVNEGIFFFKIKDIIGELHVLFISQTLIHLSIP